MFKIFKKKEKPQPRVIVHPELGELKYDGGEYLCEWDSVSTFQIALWDRTYDVSITFYTSENGEEPNLQQVEAYRKFKNIVVRCVGGRKEVLHWFLKIRKMNCLMHMTRNTVLLCFYCLN